MFCVISSGDIHTYIIQDNILISCHKCKMHHLYSILYIIVYDDIYNNLSFSINWLFTLWGRFLSETQLLDTYYQVPSVENINNLSDSSNEGLITNNCKIL